MEFIIKMVEGVPTAILLLFFVNSLFVIYYGYRVWIAADHHSSDTHDSRPSDEPNKAVLLKQSSQGPLSKADSSKLKFCVDDLPKICIQLPIFNEPEQVEGLLSSVSKIKWDYSKLDIQILDDSTDETSNKIAKSLGIIRRQSPGLKIHHIQRPNRNGFKAGALREGVKISDAEFFMIFDSDFRPKEDVALRAYEHFKRDPELSVLQFPWGYRNSCLNHLTKIQALSLDAHFYAEHYGRSKRGLAINFNGTAGMWKRSMIEKVGGWSSCTVTEDLYLSFKALMAGAKIKFDPSYEVSSTLPENTTQFLIQQRRWAKGHGQVLRLILGDIFRPSIKKISLRMDMLFHLCAYGFSSFALILYILSVSFTSEISSWHNATDHLDPFRASFFIVFLLFIYLFQLHYKKSENVKHRFGIIEGTNTYGATDKAIMLLTVAPVFVMLICPSYFQGFFHKPNSAKFLVFNRTPKKTDTGTRFSQFDLIFFLYTTFCLAVFLSFIFYGFWFGAGLFTIKLFYLIRVAFSLYTEKPVKSPKQIVQTTA